MAPALVTPTPIARPELFFALVGPTGTDLDSVKAALEAELHIVGYCLAEPLRLSQLIEVHPDHVGLGSFKGTEDERIERHMDAGDAIRRSLGNGGALAALAVAEIKRRRGNDPKPATAFLLRSLKHPKELELLRAIYGASLFVISVNDAEEAREARLVHSIERSGVEKKAAKAAARRLIERDQEGSRFDDFGQSVRKTFPLADFFVDAGRDLRSQIERLVHLIFAHPQMSPSQHEYAMFMAQAAALRSADLSRQVGAVVVGADGEVIAAGCNEVPKPEGGVYWSGERDDGRDFKQRVDPNAKMGDQILREVFSVLRDAGWLSARHKRLEPATLVEEARKQKLFEDARVANLIEFGRVVHAEMNALVHAARHGLRVGGQRLFCTTFPCHGCARHIIGAGIAQVVYIEPYPKSLAIDLYPEAICLGREEKGKVAFLPFTGVAPRRYMDFFSFGRRKDNQGFATEWNPKQASPRARQVGPPHYLFAETELCNSLDVVLQHKPSPT